MGKKLLSVVTGSFNEEGSVDEWFERVFSQLEQMSQYDWEIVWVDNASQDGTKQKVKQWCQKDKRVKLIVNARNFGPIRSPFHGLMETKGAAAIYLASDLQDPPELIASFVKEFEAGFDVVAGVYKNSVDNWLMARCRRLYYYVMRAVSEAKTIKAFTGFGLYSRRVLELLRSNGGPMPFVKGLVAEYGLPTATVAYDKERRKYGVSKNDVLGLVDQALLGITSMSRAPIRFATLMGMAMSTLGFLIALGYLMAKLVFWYSFPMGQAPLLIGIFLFASVQILVVGLIGEYIASMHLRMQNQPWVVELERVNFENEP